MKIFAKNHWGLFVVLLFSFFTVVPFFHSGFFPMHDDTQVTRVFEMSQSLKDGMFPVRWVQDLGYGYGYPIFSFYAPFAYYIGGFLLLLGLSALLATKIMMILGIILAGIFMYFLAKSFWGEFGGIFSALLYLYASYHAIDIYVRGDVAEFWAYAFVPFACWGIWQSFKTQKLRYVLIGSLGFAGIILSHNLTALLIAPFLIGLCVLLVLLSKEKRFLFKSLPIISIISGVLLSAFYWLPIPFEMKYTNVLSQVGGGADFRDHFVCLAQLWNSPWGYGGSAPGCIDGISFAIGKIYILFFIMSVFLFPFLFQKSRERAWILLGSIVVTIASCFLLLPYSQPIWEHIHILAFLQYPWRYFILVFFGLAVSSGSIFWYLRTILFAKKTWICCVILLLCIGSIIFVEVKYFTPRIFVENQSSYYTDKSRIVWDVSKISDEYLPQHFVKPQNASQTVASRFVIDPKIGVVIHTIDKAQQKEAQLTLQEPGKLMVNIAYYPAWHATVDGKTAVLHTNPAGMFIVLNKGMHTVKITYLQTTIELTGDLISLASIALGILAIIRLQRKKRL